MERRLEEARKGVADLTTFAKENSMTRYDEKLKTMQSEFFSQLRELNVRIDSKTNSS
jgi:hypothetical protein